MVVVDARGVQLLELGIQELVHVLPAFDEPGGQFGGELPLLAKPAGQGAPRNELARPRVIVPGGVNISSRRSR